MSQIKLVVKKRITEITGTGSQRLQMWVESYQDIESEVFVFLRKQPVPPAVDTYDEYTNVASAADMAEYPTDGPDPLLTAFFRLSSFDILFRSIHLLNVSVTTIEADLRNLVTNLDFLTEEGAESAIEIDGKVIT